MPLIKQLWLAITFLMIVSFIGSFTVSCFSTKNYLEEQLYQKNIDSAHMIALSLNNQSTDPIFMKLFINSQFDTGHYRFISLIDMNGDIIAGQSYEAERSTVPSWLPPLFPIKAKPGYAHVSDGWTRTATLILSSDSEFVYLQLWNNAKSLFYYFLLTAIMTGLGGSILLRFITEPLGKAVDHAEAIGERRFIITEEPKTLEFRTVIRSMNRLSERVKAMLSDEMKKLEQFQKGIQYDHVSTLFSREAILSNFNSYLEREDEYSSGMVILIRINEMQSLNQQKGRTAIDGLLKNIGSNLKKESCSDNKTLGKAGRLNGSDFLVILPTTKLDNLVFGRDMFDCVKRCCLESTMPDIKIYGASTFYHTDEQVGNILSRLDSALLSASNDDIASCIHIHADNKSSNKIDDNNYWQTYLPEAIATRKFLLELYPVKSIKGKLIHLEAPIRLIQKDGSKINAAQFIPHINRLGLSTELDALVVQLALDHIRKTQQPVGVNISATLLSQPEAMIAITTIIKSSIDIGDLLWLEVPEYGIFQSLEGFRYFNQLLKPLKCKVGIEHVGHEISCIGKLHDLGIDFVKIDSSFIRDINTNTSNQIFLRGLCTIVHSIGMEIIAEGVLTQAEHDYLATLGFDGGTGRYFA